MKIFQYKKGLFLCDLSVCYPSCQHYHRKHRQILKVSICWSHHPDCQLTLENVLLATSWEMKSVFQFVIFLTVMSSALMRNGRSEPETKTARTGRVISESESYGKLYQSLSDSRKKHFSIILAEINSKFSRNANFPL